MTNDDELVKSLERGDENPEPQRPVMDNAPSFAREDLQDEVPF